jgi:cell division protein FtsW (lipid II flippase)
MLAVLEMIGTGKGVQRWFSIGGFNLQPSEPAKLAVLIMLATYFHNIYADSIQYLRTYIPVLAIVFIPFHTDIITAGFRDITNAVVIGIYYYFCGRDTTLDGDNGYWSGAGGGAYCMELCFILIRKAGLWCF